MASVCDAVRRRDDLAYATIRDVARLADVSVASVSRVLNGHPNVRPTMRDRVEHAAATLGYVPHHGARSLSMARAHAIGVVLPDMHGEFFSEALRGMDREASARGLHLLLSTMHDDAARAIEVLRTMRGRVDGLVVMAPHVDPDLLVAHLPPGLPVVLINCHSQRVRRPELRIDNAGGAAAMVDHLVESGRRHIVHVSGPAGNTDAAERVRGYEEAMARHGLAARVLPGDFDEAAGTAAVAELIRAHCACDALFAANDMMAIGAMVALRRAGIDVPGEIAVAGFDDIPLARLVSPALTTMRTGIADIGARAVARLAAAIHGNDDEIIEHRTPALVIRETTSPANGPRKGIAT